MEVLGGLPESIEYPSASFQGSGAANMDPKEQNLPYKDPKIGPSILRNSKKIVWICNIALSSPPVGLCKSSGSFGR